MHIMFERALQMNRIVAIAGLLVAGGCGAQAPAPVAAPTWPIANPSLGPPDPRSVSVVKLNLSSRANWNAGDKVTIAGEIQVAGDISIERIVVELFPDNPLFDETPFVDSMRVFESINVIPKSPNSATFSFELGAPQGGAWTLVLTAVSADGSWRKDFFDAKVKVH